MEGRVIGACGERDTGTPPSPLPSSNSWPCAEKDLPILD